MSIKIEYNTEYYMSIVKKQNELKKKQMEYGMRMEVEAIPILNDYFKDTLVKTDNKFHKFDYIGVITKNVYELKSNTYSINSRFPNGSSCVIDKRKIDTYEGLSNLYIVFAFKEWNTIDYYYIKYDNEMFKSFTSRLLNLKRGYKNEVIDIPIDKLIPIKNEQQITDHL